MYYLYILKSVDHQKTYVGISYDPAKRLQEHNQGNSRYTSMYRPWIMIYLEQFKTINHARKREIYLKGCSGRKWMKRTLF